MKKKFNHSIALLLCLMLALNIFGCGSNASDETAKTEETKQTTETENTADTSDEKKDEDSENENSDLWANALYQENKEFGEGKTTVNVEVKVEDSSVTFTVHTDKDNLGDALLEHSLIAGEEGDYGLYVKDVNGITADYDTDKAYWAFYKDGEYMNTGVDATAIADGEHYELVYTKE